VTTSGFSSSTRETAEFLSKRIVLIDGQQLARLMIRYDVGCRVEEVLHIKKLDEEFFEYFNFARQRQPMIHRTKLSPES
jgi:restriction system protein